ncbi:hypothetical protein ACLIBH_05265 [Virgibacillus sp. W0430]|uniref:hypothetical protein n=1 Tax=Virgibacillus sp. W0430 TaxID=3391580 RepID=UPI003F481678
MSLIIVGLASGNAFAISPRAGEIAAPAITVAIEIEIIVGFSILLIIATSIRKDRYLFGVKKPSNTTVYKY